MNLNRSMLVAVAMMIGSLGAMGCKSSAGALPEGGDVQPPAADTAAPATAKDESIQAKASIMATNQAPVRYAPVAPPAPRYENPGRAPSAEQMWLEGFHRWTGRDFVWVPGHWETRREGYEFQRTSWVKENGRWECHEGRWVPQARNSDRRDRMDHDHRAAQPVQTILRPIPPRAVGPRPRAHG